MPIYVQEDDEFRPVVLVLEAAQTVASVDERSQVEEDWWKDNPVVRMYYRVTLEDGQRLTMLATSKSGTLLLRRDQGEMAVFWDFRSRRL